VLVLFSFIFYAWGQPLWVTLLLMTAVADYFLGRLIEKHSGTSSGKAILFLSVAFNIGLLVFLKYSGFLYENINALFSVSLEPPSYGLPLGISFYTFRSVSYLVDVHRKDIKAETSFLDFLMFLSLYHLVAGPIVRYSEIPDQIKQRSFNIHHISSGINRFCIGLFKKVCIANIAGDFVAQYMGGDPRLLTTELSWFGLIMFTIQIYFDFSGYSDMAIGLGRIFGFNYAENFNYPYISRSATEFWRRWHISLSSFLRDYLFTPLVLKFRNWGKSSAIIATLITFTICGLWHGPSWNYILWGFYFGALISLELLFLKKFFARIPRVFSHVYLLFSAIMGWSLFYFTDLSHLWNYLGVMFGNSENAAFHFEFFTVLKANIFWLIIAIVFCMPVYPFVEKYLMTHSKFAFLQPSSLFKTVVVIGFNICLLLLATSMLVGKSYNAFLYMKF